MSKITLRDLHPSLVRLIGQGGGVGGGFSHEKKSVIVNTDTNEVLIGIPDFDKKTDCLMVFKNSTYIEQGIDYDISADSKKIISKNGNWNGLKYEGISFNFIVFKSISNDIGSMIYTALSSNIHILENEWILNESNSLYEYTATYNTSTLTPLVIAYDNMSRSMSISVEIVDNTSIIIRSTIASECDITIIDGSLEILDNYIDDTQNTLSNTWSAKKISDELNTNKTDILTVKNELKKSVNTKYSTVNGTKEFNCKDGYVDNIYMEGETLVNLANSKTGDSVGVCSLQIKGNHIYTLIVDKKSGDGQFNFRYFDVSGNKFGDFAIYGKSDTNGIKIMVVTSPSNASHFGYYKANGDCVTENIMILEGDHTNKQIPYIEGLKSVGQGDNKIEVLTIDNNINILTSNFTDNEGYDISTGEIASSTNFCRCDDYIEINSKMVYLGNNNFGIITPIHIMCYDIDKKYLGRIQNAINNIYKLKIDTRFIRIYANKSIDSNPITFEQFKRTYIYSITKCDKKQINQTFRSLPNGVKDELIKMGNSYYKLKKCDEFILDDNYEFLTGRNQTNTIEFAISKSNSEYKITNNVMLSDEFIHEYSGNDFEHIYLAGATTQVFINKNKISPVSVEGFKIWIKSNPITVVCELAEPKLIPLPNFNPQTFADKTTFLLNSGVVQGECDFEVTNSLDSEIEVLKDKVSNLDDHVNPNIISFKNDIQLLNGWTYYGSSSFSSAYICDNFVHISLLLTPGSLDRFSNILKIPKKYAPNNIEFVTALDSNSKVYRFKVQDDGLVITENALTSFTNLNLNISYPKSIN